MDDRNEQPPLLRAMMEDPVTDTPAPPQEPRPYPEGPGHRGIDTSMAAAAKIAPRVGTLQAKALAAIREAGWNGLTALELADRLDVDRFSIQPRTSELRQKRLIMDSGRRRQNPSGVSAIVWVTNPEPMGNQVATTSEAA